MRWETFKGEAPELASLAYEKLHGKVAYLATIKKDGSPRLHPVKPFIGNGMLFIFTEPSSPKIKDLKWYGRYALHCAVDTEGPLIEVLVSGYAETVSNPLMREQAVRITASAVVNNSYYLFEFHIKHVLVVEYDQEGKPIVRTWKEAQIPSCQQLNQSTQTYV
jgi:hypothetical protein